MDDRPDIPLNALRAVETVSRLGSLRAAADALGVTQGAVSQQIRRAEQSLATTLFERTPQGLRPTETGRLVASDLTRGFALIEQAVAAARPRTSGGLTVSVAPVFASKWLVWRMQAFAKAHPDLSLRIEASVDFVPLRRGGADLAIRVGRGDWRDVHVRKLADQILFPVLAPALAEGVASAGDLRRFPVLRDLNDRDRWPEWWLATGASGPPPDRGGLSYSDSALCLDAAIAGQGMFLAWPSLAGDAIARGQLVRPVPGTLATGLSYWLVSGTARLTPDQRAFHDWLRDALDTSYHALDIATGREGVEG